VAVVAVANDPAWQPAGARARHRQLDLLGADEDGDRAGGLGRLGSLLQGEPAEHGVHHGAVPDTLDEIGVADEACHVRVDRACVEVLGGGALRDRAVPQDGDEIRGGQRFVLVVGDQDGGGARLAEQLLDVRADAGPQMRVQGGKGLVEQDDLRPDGEGTGQRYPLLLPAGELVRVATGEAGQPGRVEQLGGALSAPVPPGQAEPDVRLDREVREKAALLRDIADAAPFGGQVDAGPVRHGGADRDRSTVCLLEAGQHPQQRGLATAGRAEDRGQRAGGHVQVEPAQHLVSTEPLVQPGDRQLGHVIILGSAAPRSKNRPSTQLGMAATAIITRANGAACP
jgi:hypothetical protein